MPKNDLEEYNQLSDLDKFYVSSYGWDAYHRKKALEENARKLQLQQQQQPQQTETEPLEEEQLEETEQFSELDDLKLENEQKKSEILDQIADRLDEEESAEQQADDLIRFIKSDPSIEQSVKSYLGLLLAFPRFPDVDKVTITMQRDDDKVHFGYKCLDKNGFDIGFDKNGRPYLIESGKK